MDYRLPRTSGEQVGLYIANLRLSVMVTLHCKVGSGYNVVLIKMCKWKLQWVNFLYSVSLYPFCSRFESLAIGSALVLTFLTSIETGMVVPLMLHMIGQDSVGTRGMFENRLF